MINFQQVSTDYKFNTKEQKIILQLKGSKRSFIMKCNNKEEFDQWKEKLTHAISNSNGKVKGLAINEYY